MSADKDKTGPHMIQDPFLNVLRKESVPINIFLVSGIKLQGKIDSFDTYVILLASGEEDVILVYKSNICSIVPSRAVAFDSRKIITSRVSHQTTPAV